MASMSEEPPTPNATTQRPTSKPFRFKQHRQRTPSPSAAYRQRSASPSTSHRSSRRSHHHHRQHHRHHHRSRRRPHTPIDDPTLYDDTYLPNSKSEQYLDPDVAFRESLFDALADDEGALYWEGVYGQPIHNYPRYREANDDDDDNDPEHPKLERMTDEEYVNYVRGKMWEKSHQHILEERRKREVQRKRDKGAEERNRRWQASLDDGMRRVEERRKKERWRGVWKAYGRKWDGTFSDGAKGSIKERISWPVESGRWQDVGKEAVEAFFRHGAGAEGVGLGEVLKRERVRWHPDKMQQRAGSGGIDDGTMKAVTAVFQAVDRMWGETRGKA